MRWKKPVTMAIGMNFGSPLNGGGAKLRPFSSYVEYKDCQILETFAFYRCLSSETHLFRLFR
jgi:hypothetical protein